MQAVSMQFRGHRCGVLSPRLRRRPIGVDLLPLGPRRADAHPFEVCPLKVPVVAGAGASPTIDSNRGVLGLALIPTCRWVLGRLWGRESAIVRKRSYENRFSMPTRKAFPRILVTRRATHACTVYALVPT